MHRLLCALTIILAVSGAARAGGIVLQEGDYMSEDFIEALRATKSPVAALGQGVAVPQSIRVENECGSFRFQANENWHEGYDMFILHPDGTRSPGAQRVLDPPPIIDSSTEFRIQGPAPEHFYHGYTYVGDANAAVARLSLVGKYEENNGHIVEFGDDGIVHGLGPDQPYILDNDHALGPDYDYFYLGNRQHPVAFEHKGRHLTLYPIAPATDGPIDLGDRDLTHPLKKLELLTDDNIPLQTQGKHFQSDAKSKKRARC